MPNLTVLVGPPASGKSTLRNKLIYEDGDHAPQYYVNQDEHGKNCLADIFMPVIKMGQDIVVDRMGFNKEQRQRYIAPAKAAGYTTKIIVLHESKETCIKRGLERLQTSDHPTVKTEQDLRRATGFFFSHYERPTSDEADTIEFRYPEQTLRLKAIICDIDGTMANIKHRQHMVQGEKKDWKSFLHPSNVEQDTLNTWCKTITNNLRSSHIIIMCSGRPDSLEAATVKWLRENKVQYDHLFMRPRDDHRKDDIIKEIVLDFEILTRVTPFFAIDDRDQVVKMWRERGITTLQCDYGAF